MAWTFVLSGYVRRVAKRHSTCLRAAEIRQTSDNKDEVIPKGKSHIRVLLSMVCHAIREKSKIGLNRIINRGQILKRQCTWMTNKLSYSSSWQFVFWDNEWYQVSLQQKYIDALHVYVLKHSLTPCKSNSELSIFIQFAMNFFYKAIIEPPIFPSLPTSFRIVISFV